MRGIVSKRFDRGMTIVEVAIAIIVAVAAAAIVMVMLRKPLQTQRETMSTSYLHGIAQAFIVWDQHNNGYPVPSALDLKNTTTAEIGAAKDHSANMWSILIYNSFVPVDLLVSPLEKNGNITPFAAYAMNTPAAAVDPPNALWDPAFSADFTKGTGGVSYANMPHTPARRKLWQTTNDARIALISDRGPQVMGIAAGGGGVMLANQSSNSLWVSRRTGTWQGGVAYSDASVETYKSFENGWCHPSQQSCTYVDSSGQTRTDIPFFDEPDDPSRTNTYLGIFTTAGEKDSDFTAIWD